MVVVVGVVVVVEGRHFEQEQVSMKSPRRLAVTLAMFLVHALPVGAMPESVKPRPDLADWDAIKRMYPESAAR